MAPHLLDIPPELRYLIYDHLFSKAVSRPSEESRAYRLPNEWPETDIGDFISISVASRQLRQETVPYFERFYLPGAKLYFDRPPQLYLAFRAIQILAARKPEYNTIVYSVRSYPDVLMSRCQSFDRLMEFWIDYSELVCMATESLHTYDIVPPDVGTHVCRNCLSRLTIFNQAFPQFGSDGPASTAKNCKAVAIRHAPTSTSSNSNTPNYTATNATQHSAPSLATPSANAPTTPSSSAPKSPNMAKIAHFQVRHRGVDMSVKWCRKDTKTLYAELTGLFQDIWYGKYETRAMRNRFASRASRDASGLEAVSEEKMALLFEMVEGAMEAGGEDEEGQ